MAFYKQSTAYTRMFKMIDSADHFSKKTGLTCTVNLSKAGAAFGAAGGTITEVANGWYKIALSTTDTNTVGDLAFYITATGADDTDFTDQVWVRDLADLAYPATSGRSMVVDAAGLVDANTVKLGPTGSGTAQTARDIGTSVLLSTGTGTGQLDFTSGVVKTNVTQLLGTAWLTPGTAGTPDVNVKLWNALSTVALPLVPTVAGRTLDVSAGGEAGLDWANVGSPSTSVNLSATTVNLVNTATTVTNQLTAAAIATGIWQDTTAGDFTTAASIGKSIMNGVALGTGLTINSYTGNTPQTGDSFARIGLAGVGLTNIGDTRIANLDAAVSSRMATYTQPTGFLSATFPTGTIANTTNITAGTITTATNLTTNNDKTGYSLTQSFPSNFSSLSITAAGLVAITSNRKKGASATIEFTMTDSTTGADTTGLTVTSVVSKDGGAFASTSNSVTEIADGWYSIVLTATEMTANNIALQFTAASAINRDIFLQTQP